MARWHNRLVTTVASLGLGLAAGTLTGFPFDRVFELIIRAMLAGIPPLVFLIVAGTISDSTPRDRVQVTLTIGWYVGVAYVAALFAVGITSLVVDAPLGRSLASGHHVQSAVSISGVVLAVLSGVGVGLLGHVSTTIGRALEVGESLTLRAMEGASALYPGLAFLGGASLVATTASLGSTIRIYLILSGLTLLMALLWQGGWILVASTFTEFDLRAFGRYYADVAGVPLATSSEAASIPGNVTSARDHLPLAADSDLEYEFVLGGALNTPGSVMNGVLFAGALSHFAFGYTPSVGTLLVFGLGSATVLSASPGVPGELALLLPMVSETLPVPAGPFATAWLSLQVGIPDAIRTTVNVTDDGIYAHFLRRVRQGRTRRRKERNRLEAEY